MDWKMSTCILKVTIPANFSFLKQVDFDILKLSVFTLYSDIFLYIIAFFELTQMKRWIFNILVNFFLNAGYKVSFLISNFSSDCDGKSNLHTGEVFFQCWSNWRNLLSFFLTCICNYRKYQMNISYLKRQGISSDKNQLSYHHLNILRPFIL